jgi:hypothetical protein
MATEKLEAARRTGSLTNVIGALREEARADVNAGTSPREQVDVVDGAIRVAAHLSGQGKTGAERRQALSGVQVGTTVTAQGAAKTLLSRAEKIDRVKAWASSLTEEQRTEYMIGEKYGALSENAQDVIAEAFGQIEDRAYEDSIGVENFDLNGELPDVDAIVGDDDEDEVVDDADDDYEALFEQANPWPGDAV